MLESSHKWKRFRTLLLIGTLLGLGAGLFIAMMGGGVWALVIQPILFGLPAAVDLFLFSKFKPVFSFDLGRFRPAISFGLDRAGSGLVTRGRVLLENGLISGFFSLATLGIFNRAVGLGNLLIGRIGPTVMMSLHPVITRAEPGSLRFQRLAGLILRGVCWLLVPTIVFTVFMADELVTLLYGNKWAEVAPLLAMAAIFSGVSGIYSVLGGILVANNDSRLVLYLDLLYGVGLAMLALILIPNGALPYLKAISVWGGVTVVGALVICFRKKALNLQDVVDIALPSLLGAGLSLLLLNAVEQIDLPAFSLFFDTLISAILVYGMFCLVLRSVFKRQLRQLLEVVPAGDFLRRAFFVS